MSRLRATYSTLIDSAMKKTQFLIWAVIILFAMNVATIVTIVVSRSRTVKQETTNVQPPPTDPDAVRFHFFAQELGLKPDQMDAFRNANRNFNPRLGNSPCKWLACGRRWSMNWVKRIPTGKSSILWQLPLEIYTGN